jgi:4-hydroxy-tetrahydrodipicolinate reductase
LSKAPSLYYIGIAGVNGKMGHILLQYGIKFHDNSVYDKKYQVIAAYSRSKMNEATVRNIGEKPVKLTDNISDFVQYCDVIIDFTAPDLSLKLAQECQIQGKALVCGTTGFTAENLEKLEQIAQNTRIFLAPNMSLGINVLKKLMLQANFILNSQNIGNNNAFDLEIVEYHHAKKKDAPSGTALMLGQSLINSRNNDVYADKTDIISQKNLFLNCNRCSQQAKPRDPAEIGISVVRGGGVFGEHEILFMGQNEVIKLKHTALNREIFAEGAYKAAEFILAQAPGGIYGMDQLVAQLSI